MGAGSSYWAQPKKECSEEHELGRECEKAKLALVKCFAEIYLRHKMRLNEKISFHRL